MPKCENCYHCNVCKDYLKELGYTMGVDIRTTRCPYYKDKSLIYEMPCKEVFEKIGDSLYYIDETNKVVEVIVGSIEVDCEGREWINTMIIDYDCEDDVTSKYISFRFADFGKTLFLTREEAEKALREREKNG